MRYVRSQEARFFSCDEPPPVTSPSEWKRNRSRPRTRGLEVALGASFLGLLLVREDARAEENDPSHPGSSLDPVSAFEPRVVTAEPGGAPVFEATPPMIAPGSVLTAGAFLDPVLLTRLAGEARFDHAPILMLRPEPAIPSASAQAPTAAPTPEAAITHAPPSFVPFLEPAVSSGEETGEDLGPIGEEIVGGDQDELLVGGPDDDRIDGGGGDDTILGGGGNDVLAGGPGNDTIDGGPGHDRIDGGPGNDQLQGGPGNDTILGGPGDDTIDGGPGDDEVRPGSGDDTVTVGGPADLVFEDPWGPAAGGRDTLVVAPDFGAQLEKAFPSLARGGVATFMVGDAIHGSPPPGAPAFTWQVPPNVENVRLTGNAAHAIVGDAGANVLEGNEGANAIWGGAGDDRIRGGGGNDRLFGGEGDDLIFGDAGDDLLSGGPGDDLLYGGPGDDVYLLGLAEPGCDTIVDHEGINLIRLEGGAAERLALALEGPDLVIAYDGRQLAVVKGYLGHEAAWAGIEVGGSLVAFDQLLSAAPAGASSGPLAASTAGARAASFASPADAASGPALPEIFPGADLWGDTGGSDPAGELQHLALEEERGAGSAAGR